MISIVSIKKYRFSFVRLPLLVIFFLLLQACSSKVGWYLAPGEFIEPELRYRLVPNKGDDRGLAELVGKKLRQEGYWVHIGDDIAAEEYDIDIVYGGQWQWDITWYLLNLDVRFYNAKSKSLVASAYSHRSSLLRKAPEDVVAEAINGLLLNAKLRKDDAS